MDSKDAPPRSTRASLIKLSGWWIHSVGREGHREAYKNDGHPDVGGMRRVYGSPDTTGANAERGDALENGKRNEPPPHTHRTLRFISMPWGRAPLGRGVKHRRDRRVHML